MCHHGRQGKVSDVVKLPDLAELNNTITTENYLWKAA